MSGADAQGLTEARAAYKAYETVARLMDKAAVGSGGRTAGDVAASLLSEAVRQSDPNLSSKTTPPALAELAQIGSRLVDRAPQSGGSIRAGIQNSALAGAAGYGAHLSPVSAAVGVPATLALQWALGSPAMRKLLTKPAANRGLLDSPELFPAPAEAGLLGVQRGTSQGAIGLLPR